MKNLPSLTGCIYSCIRGGGSISPEPMCEKVRTGNEELVKKFDLILKSYKRKVLKSSLRYTSR